MPPAPFPNTAQDIPLEQSERLPFTPASLADVPDPPIFSLRSPTKRDERHHRRLMREEGIVRHSDDAIRREVFAALEQLWSADDFAKHAPRIREYYEAVDQHRLQAGDDPALEFQWDKEDEAKIRHVVADVVRSWPKLRRMTADNAESAEMQAPMIAAVVVDTWTGLDTTRHLDRGYLAAACAEQLIDDLDAFERKHAEQYGLTTGTAALELYVACMRRLYLDEEEVGNFASPSPSPTPPPNSSEPKASGKSRASARSRKTPATA